MAVETEQLLIVTLFSPHSFAACLVVADAWHRFPILPRMVVANQLILLLDCGSFSGFVHASSVAEGRGSSWLRRNIVGLRTRSMRRRCGSFVVPAQRHHTKHRRRKVPVRRTKLKRSATNADRHHSLGMIGFDIFGSGKGSGS
jgi:hypothetical protein